MHLRLGTAPILLLALLLPAVAGAQLRPLSPFDWEVVDSARMASVRAGVGVLRGQRASLAGTEGDLWELGDVAAAWRTGRVVLEASGTMLRVFQDRSTFAPPYGGARPDAGPTRRDAGDFRVSTTVVLRAAERPVSVMLRFGTRLPTTDNGVGLERDQTDFFALLGGRVRQGRFRLGGEAGVGINGTREVGYEQSDVLAYALWAAYEAGWLAPRVGLVGHADGRTGRSTRGNEELAELRVGTRAGGRTWVEAQWVRGLTPFSPRGGLLLAVGRIW